jgi:hypothetical protein
MSVKSKIIQNNEIIHYLCIDITQHAEKTQTEFEIHPLELQILNHIELQDKFISVIISDNINVKLNTINNSSITPTTALFIVGYDKFWDVQTQKETLCNIITNLHADVFIVSYEGCFMDAETLFHENLRYICRKNVEFYNTKMRNIISINNHPQPTDHNLNVFLQYYHVENCFDEMKTFEESINTQFKYIFKVRTDIKLQNFNWDICSFIQPKRIYMESDYMYYGMRDEMNIACHVLSAKFSYYDKTRWDERPINYETMLQTLENNPSYIFDTDRWNPSLFKNKLPAIPMPIIPEKYGVLMWEQSPRKYFIDTCKYFLDGEGRNLPKNNIIPMTSLTLFDREPNLFQCEYFIIDWIIRHNIIVCEPIYFGIDCVLRCK